MSRNQRLNATLTIGAAMQASVRRNFDIVGRGMRQIGAEISTVTARTRELDRERRVLERQGQSVEALDREYEDLNRTLGRLESRQRRLGDVAAGISGVGGAFGRMTGEMQRFAQRTTVAVGAASAAIFGLATRTATMGDDVAKTADRLGVGIEALQEFRYVGERVGLGAEGVDAAFAAMNLRVGEAAMGMGEAQAAFTALNLSADELSNMSAEERFEAIATALGGVENSAQAAALSQRVFGADLANLTALTAEQRAAMRDEGRSLGHVLTEEQVRNAETFIDQLTNATLALTGFSNTIGAELMPTVGAMMETFTNWFRDNREVVADYARRFGESFAATVPLIGEAVAGLQKLGTTVGHGAARLAEFVGGWDNLAIAVGALFAGKAIASVIGFGLAVGKLAVAMVALAAPAVLPAVAGGIGLIGAALVANPIGATVTAIALAAGLVIANWGEIRPHLEPIFQWFGAAVGFLNDNVVAPFTEGIGRRLGEALTAWTLFRDGLGAVVDWLSERFQALMNVIRPILEVRAQLGEIGASVAGAIGGAIMGDGPVAGGSGGRAQRRMVGGSFLPGAVLVGEGGPELRFEDRAGFIATNRQLESMAARAEQIRQVAFGGAGRMAEQAPGAINNTIAALHVHAAPGMDARQLVDQIDAEFRRRGRGALFDRAAGRPI